MQKLHKFVLLDFFHSTCRGIEQLQDLWLVPTYKVGILWIYTFTKKEFPGVCYVNAATMQFVHETRVNQPSLHSSSGVRIPKPGSQKRHKNGAQKPVISRGPYNSTIWGFKKKTVKPIDFRPFIRVITPLCRLCSPTLLQHLSEGRIQLLSSSDPRSGVTKQFPPLSGYGRWLVHFQIHSTSFNIIQPFNS